MESVADLRTQLCEEEHKLCDWHGTVWHRLNGLMIVWNWRQSWMEWGVDEL